MQVLLQVLVSLTRRKFFLNIYIDAKGLLFKAMEDPASREILLMDYPVP